MTVNWEESRLIEIQDKLSPYLRHLNFTKNDITYIPCSGLLGDFLKDRPPAELCPWYTVCFKFIGRIYKF